MKLTDFLVVVGVKVLKYAVVECLDRFCFGWQGQSGIWYK